MAAQRNSRSSLALSYQHHLPGINEVNQRVERISIISAAPAALAA